MRVSFLGVCLLIASCLQAQRISKTFLPQHDEPEPLNSIVRAGNYLIDFDNGEVNTKFFLTQYKRTPDKFAVIIYDTNMNKLSTIPVTEPELKYGPVFGSIEVVNNKPYLIYYDAKRPEKVANIMAILINPENQTIGKAMNIGNAVGSNFDYSGFLWSNRQLSLSFKQSPDKAFQLLMLNTPRGNCFVSVLDKEMNLLWSLDNVFQKNEQALIKSFCIDNLGNVFLGIQYEKKKGVDMRLVQIINGQRQQDIQLDVPSANSFAPELLISKNKPGVIEIAGMTESNRGYGSGVFHTSFDKANQNIAPVVYIPFSNKLLEHLDSLRWANKYRSSNRYGIHSIMKATFRELENGDITGLAELHEETFINSAGNSTPAFKFGPILYFAIKDSTETFATLLKGAYSIKTFGGTLDTVFTSGNEMIVFHTEHADNLKSELSESVVKKYNKEDRLLLVSFINQDGSVHREVITHSDPGFLPVPRRKVKISENRWLIPFLNYKNTYGKFVSEQWISITIN